MAVGLILLLRLVQGVFALIVLGLSGYVVHWYNADTLTASPSQVNFLIFVPVFSLLSIAYLELTPRFLAKASHPYAHFAFEVANVLFYFAGFVALATFLGKLLFCRGSVCSAARADAVFAASGFLLWAASCALLALEIFKGGFKGFRTDQKAKSSMKEAKTNTSPA